MILVSVTFNAYNPTGATLTCQATTGQTDNEWGDVMVATFDVTVAYGADLAAKLAAIEAATRAAVADRGLAVASDAPIHVIGGLHAL